MIPSRDHVEIILDAQSIQEIKNISMYELLTKEANVDPDTFHVLNTLRALEKYMKTHRVEPNFEISYEK